MAGVLFKLEIPDFTSWKLQLHKVVTWLNMSGLTMGLELQNKFWDFDSVYAWKGISNGALLLYNSAIGV